MKTFLLLITGITAIVCLALMLITKDISYGILSIINYMTFLSVEKE